jgi:hypothetical protein
LWPDVEDDKEMIVQSVKRFFSTLWEAWKKVGKFIGDLIGRAFLMLFYITVALPFGLGVSLFGDPLHVKDRTHPVHWIERKSPDSTLESSYNQF